MRRNPNPHIVRILQNNNRDGVALEEPIPLDQIQNDLVSLYTQFVRHLTELVSVDFEEKWKKWLKQECENSMTGCLPVMFRRASSKNHEVLVQEVTERWDELNEKWKGLLKRSANALENPDKDSALYRQSYSNKLLAELEYWKKQELVDQPKATGWASIVAFFTSPCCRANAMIDKIIEWKAFLPADEMMFEGSAVLNALGKQSVGTGLFFGWKYEDKVKDEDKVKRQGGYGNPIVFRRDDFNKRLQQIISAFSEPSLEKAVPPLVEVYDNLFFIKCSLETVGGNYKSPVRRTF